LNRKHEEVKSMMDALRTLKMWQVATLVIVLAAMGGGTFGAYTLLHDGDGDALEEDQSIIPVQRGDLVNDVSISGTLVYPNREALTFGTQGSVGQVLVEEGQQVQQGQPLVVLDDETVANLEKAVAQARVGLRDAEEALADVVSVASGLDLAQTQAAVADAKVSHAVALEALARVADSYPRLLAQAEVAAASARVALRDAEEALESILEPPLAEDVARLETAVTDARIALDESRQSLDELLVPTGEILARAEGAVSDTEIAFRGASDALDELLNPTERRIADAAAAVTDSRQALDVATERLETLNSGPDADVLAAAQSDVTSAAGSLSEAGIDLQLTTRSWDDKLEAATEVSDDALEGYRQVYLKWLGVELTAEEGASDPTTLLAEWNVDLHQLFDPGTRFTELAQLFTPGAAVDDPLTRWDEATVITWANFFPGAIRASCEDETLPDEQVCVRGEIDAAWDTLVAAGDAGETTRLEADKAVGRAVAVMANAEESLTSAEDRLADLLAVADLLDIASAEGDVELARLALESAEENEALLSQEPDAIDVAALRARLGLASADLGSAEADLAVLVSGPDEIDVEERTNLVSLAEARLDKAIVDLALLVAGPDELDIESKRRQVALALADLDSAESDLAVMVTGVDPLELDAAESRVDVTLALLDGAEADLAELLAGADAIDVSLREADVASATASLVAAVQRLEDAVIVAPWDGIVSLLNVEEGDQVNGGTTILEVVDPTVVEVDGIVDEIDVLFVQPGARASISMDAIPGEELNGQVSEVATEAINQQGVVSYPLRIRVQTPQGVLLPEGLSAVAQVIIREERGVLLLPVQALRGSFDEPVVLVSMDGRIEERHVVLGSSDGFWVVIESGLAEAEPVVMESQQASTQQGFAAIRGLIGGGFGGGNFQRGGGGGGR
jgi:HlyD family secretion protein